jgi:hypothetical protein
LRDRHPTQSDERDGSQSWQRPASPASGWGRRALTEELPEVSHVSGERIGRFVAPPRLLGEHALEQALLLKEKHGGKVTVVAMDAPELDESLFMAFAKGADRVAKLAGDLAGVQSFSAARLFAEFLKSSGQPLSADTLILLRSQAMDDLEGEIGPFLADLLGIPYVGVVTGVCLADLGNDVCCIDVDQGKVALLQRGFLRLVHRLTGTGGVAAVRADFRHLQVEVAGVHI